MWYRSVSGFLTSASRDHRGRHRRLPAVSRLLLEMLEDRCLPSFSAPVSYAVGSSPQAVAVGDFNGDGRQDLAVVSLGTNTLSVLLANADGTFQPAQSYATGFGPVSVAVGDFNGDGRPDIVTGNANDNTLSVLLNNGNGTFGAPTSINLDASPQSVAVGDFNHDGKLDLGVTSNFYYPGFSGYYGFYPGNWVARASVLLGNGTGSFAAPSTEYLPGFHAGAAVGDFNSDGNLDIATGDSSYGGVDVLPGDGTGALGSPGTVDPSFAPQALAAADVNGDGKADLVTAIPGSNSVRVLMGDGTGNFPQADSYAAGSNPVSVAMADLNGDGLADVITANSSDNTVSVLLNNGHGGFGLAQNFAVGGSAPFSVAVGDFNGDGKPDVAVANAGSNSVAVLLNTGSWPMLSVSGVPSPDTAGQIESITVTATDSGHVLTGYTGKVHFSSSDPQAVLPDDYTFMPGDQGTHTFTVDLKTAGVQSILVSDAANGISGIEADITVNPAPTSAFTVSGFPSPTTAGAAGSFTVVAVDPYGNQIRNYSGTVHFSSSDPQAVLPGDTTLTSGAGQFSATLVTVGNQSITATDKQNSTLKGSETAIRVLPLASMTGPTAGGINQTFTFTLGASGDPPGTLFTYQIDWNGDGIADQSVTGPTGTTVTHTYSTAGYYYANVTATDPGGFTSPAAYNAVYIVPLLVSIQTDPAQTGRQMLVLNDQGSYDNIVLASAAGNGVAVTFDGTALPSILPTNGNPFALVMLSASAGNDILDARGLSISSVLVGGSGNDTLYGGSARNLLIGGQGSDTLYAGSAGDILIAGYTSYDGNATALAYIMAEWNRTDVTYATRVKQLSGSQSGGLNGSYVLSGSTDFDDKTSDQLYGGAGLDWYLGHVKGNHTDKVIGQTSGEVVTKV
jgi:hypothetical protein